MSEPERDSAFESRFVTAPDGVRLHASVYGAGRAGAPVLCLPGLARTSADFDPLARALSEGAAGAPRRVVALDYRGRGLSDLDPDGRYEMATENADILAVCDALEVAEAIVVGTSRGGLHAMLFGATRPTLLRGVVLNDVGPRLEAAGLMRIRGYVGKLPAPRDMADAVDLLRTLMQAQFSALGEADWRLFAETTFQERDGGIVPRYDPRLAKTLEALDLDSPLPEFWPQFEALAHAPVLAIRGERSDLLSDATLREMAARHPRLTTLTVAGQGHAPLLADAPTIARIAEFVRAAG
ncbi:MAG: alpha/beta hydrolase [Rhizobiales bacterium]|nr:alpha/beta hydrolase [Hyphomicrobiales bacterium]